MSWTLIAGLGVVVVGLFLVTLGLTMLFAPARAAHFLGAFASSPRAHYVEQAARLAAGGALVVYSPSMWLARPFEVFGWVLVGTSLALLVIPWTWHRRFARWVVPLAVRHLPLYGACSLGFGAVVLWGVSRSVQSS